MKNYKKKTLNLLVFTTLNNTRTQLNKQTTEQPYKRSLQHSECKSTMAVASLQLCDVVVVTAVAVAIVIAVAFAIVVRPTNTCIVAFNGVIVASLFIKILRC